MYISEGVSECGRVETIYNSYFTAELHKFWRECPPPAMPPFTPCETNEKTEDVVSSHISSTIVVVL